MGVSNACQQQDQNLSHGNVSLVTILSARNKHEGVPLYNVNNTYDI